MRREDSHTAYFFPHQECDAQNASMDGEPFMKKIRSYGSGSPISGEPNASAGLP